MMANTTTVAVTTPSNNKDTFSSFRNHATNA